MSYSSDHLDYTERSDTSAGCSSEELHLEYHEDPPPSSHRALLRRVVQNICEVDIFAYGGRLSNHPLPALRIQGLQPELVALPLEAAQAAALSAICEKAPFGRGKATLIDESVRRCRQLEPSQLSLGAAWHDRMQQLVEECADALGVCGAVRATLHKLLLYEDGDFFKTHKDTEKEAGMFGTLMVQLPCRHDAGALLVRYRGEEMEFAFAEGSAEWICFAAFFADCEHECTVVRGRRLVLVYNLVKSGEVSQLREDDEWVNMAKRAGKMWIDSDEEPDRLVFKLRHEYTEESLGFEGLKGADWAVARVLRQAGMFRMELALLQLYKYFIYGDDGDIVNETSVLHVVDEKEGLVPSGFEIERTEKDLETRERVFDLERKPDKDYFFGNMGNEGAQRKKWYHAAVLVVWPKMRGGMVRWSGDFDKALEHVRNTLKVDFDNAEEVLYGALENVRRGITCTWETFFELFDISLDVTSARCVRVCLDVLHSRSKGDHIELVSKVLHKMKWQDVEVSVKPIVKTSLKSTINEWVALIASLHNNVKTPDNGDGLAKWVLESSQALLRFSFGSYLGKIFGAAFGLLHAYPHLDEQRQAFVDQISGITFCSHSSKALQVFQQVDKKWLGDVWGFKALKSLVKGYMGYAFEKYQVKWEAETAGEVLGCLLQLEADEIVGMFVDRLMTTENMQAIKTVMESKHVAKARGNGHVRRMFEAVESSMCDDSLQ